MNPYAGDWRFLFELRVILDGSRCSIYVRENGTYWNGGTKYTCSVRHKGKWIFRDDVIVGSFSPAYSIDGPDARAHILNHLATKPGDTDTDFFEPYNADQLDFVESYSDELYMTSIDRYGEL